MIPQYNIDNYNPVELANWTPVPKVVWLQDTIGGFDENLNNAMLADVNALAQQHNARITVISCYAMDSIIQDKYPNLDFNLYLPDYIWNPLTEYGQHPPLNYQNFVCSFNGSMHVSRRLLVAIMNRFGWFDPKYSSKNFEFTADIITGHLRDYIGNEERFYNKFFMSNRDNTFLETKYSFGHNRFDHGKNIYNLENKLVENFIHIVSCNTSTSYYPLVDEKFLYSVVTRGLYVAYGAPGWHRQVKQYYGFKLYQNLFDYRFDSIINPVERLLEMMSMLAKYSVLSADEWRNLYSLEVENIEFNYDHYRSGDYRRCLEQHWPVLSDSDVKAMVC